MTTLVLSILNGSSFADKKDNYESLDEFEFRQDPITYYRISSPWASYKLIDKVVTTLVSFDLIFFILSCNKDNNKSLDEFEIQQDLTRDLWVSYPWASRKIPIDL